MIRQRAGRRTGKAMQEHDLPLMAMPRPCKHHLGSIDGTRTQDLAKRVILVLSAKTSGSNVCRGDCMRVATVIVDAGSGVFTTDAHCIGRLSGTHTSTPACF